MNHVGLGSSWFRGFRSMSLGLRQCSRADDPFPCAVRDIQPAIHELRRSGKRYPNLCAYWRRIGFRSLEVPLQSPRGLLLENEICESSEIGRGFDAKHIAQRVCDVSSTTLQSERFLCRELRE